MFIKSFFRFVVLNNVVNKKISGGISSSIAGGNFWTGARQGIIVSALNHAAHTMLNPRKGELYLFQDTERVYGHGHTGIGGKLADSGKDSYRFVAKDGRIDTDGNAITGGASKYTNKYYPSYESMISSKEISGNYNKMMTISNLSYKQVAKALNVAYQSAQTDYHFIMANCFHIARDALTSIGLYGGGKGTFIPNTGFYNIYYEYKPKNGMNKLFRFFSCMTTFLMIGCNIDVADKTKVIQVSETIEESKAKGVFLAEYEANMDIIEKSWAEEPWLYDTDGNVKKLGGNELYLLTNEGIGLSLILERCTHGDTSHGNKGIGKKHYITMRLSEEELSQDTLIYYVFGGKEKKCLGELILIKK